MEKVKEFIKKYKAELLIALGAISTIVASITTMDGVNATICSIVIAIVAVLIGVLKNGFEESTITLIANAIKIIIDSIDEKNKNIKTANKELTIDEIKERLRANYGL